MIALQSSIAAISLIALFGQRMARWRYAWGLTDGEYHGAKPGR